MTPPVQFITILDRHVSLEPIKYSYHPGSETPHLFTFPMSGHSRVGHMVSFSINMMDLKTLMDQHKLMRIQSNESDHIPLYFGGWRANQ